MCIRDRSQDGTGEFYILPLLACVGITSLCKASNLVELFVSLEVLTLSSFIMASQSVVLPFAVKA